MAESEWLTPDEMLKTMGMSLEEAQQARDLGFVAPSRQKTDRRICACGHRVSAHTEVAGVTFCKPTRMECPCKKCRPVMEVENTRYFIRATHGGGALHALSQGLVNLAEEGKGAKWIIDLKCDRCGTTTDGPPIPVPVTQNGIAVDYATGFDALLCPTCRTEV